MKKLVSLLMLLSLLVVGATSAMAETPSYTEVWDGRGTDSEKCDLVGQVGRPASGWIHWVFSTKGESTSAELVLGGTGSGTYDPGEPLNAETWHFYTSYFDLDGLTATINLFGGAPGTGGGLVISDYCPGAVESLDVSKTVVTSFDREHFWDIGKNVETENEEFVNGTPKIWLYTDGSGDETATWTVDVSYEGYEDDNFNVSGDVTIINDGSIDAVITDIDDVLAGTSIDVDCGVDIPHTLPVGETLTCSYSEDVDSKIEGDNVVTVKTERHQYGDTKAIVWGDPAKEINETVDIKDVSDLFGDVTLGKVTAPNGDSFTYDKAFAYVDYGQEECGSVEYDNTATIVQTKQSASAQLKVNVQCLIFDGETAWAANGDEPLELRYTQRGNWATYVEYSDEEKKTTLFAGQTIPVGNVTFGAKFNGEVKITLSLTDDWEFEDVAENLKVQDYSSDPSGNPEPGLFAHKEDCDASSDTCSITVPANDYYGVHVDVGQWVPDPNFGP